MKLKTTTQPKGYKAKKKSPEQCNRLTKSGGKARNLPDG